MSSLGNWDRPDAGAGFVGAIAIGVVIVCGILAIIGAVTVLNWIF